MATDVTSDAKEIHVEPASSCEKTGHGRESGHGRARPGVMAAKMTPTKK